MPRNGNYCKKKGYKSWDCMKTRCCNKNSSNYKNYGGRGIRICDRWKDSFKNFLEDMGERPMNMSLDRINNNGDYEPNNCKWSSIKEQNNNMRCNRLITFKGRTKNLTQWAEDTGMDGSTLWHRLKNGWSINKSLTTKVRIKKYIGITKNI